MSGRCAAIYIGLLALGSCGAPKEPAEPEVSAGNEQASHSSVLQVEPAANELIAWERLDTPAVAEVTVDWTEADQYEGKTIAVEGKIVDTYNSGRACFLNFTTEWQGKFYLAILGSSLNDYPESPENYFMGKTVRAVGKVKMYKGRPQIVVDTPQHITVLDD